MADTPGADEPASQATDLRMAAPSEGDVIGYPREALEQFLAHVDQERTRLVGEIDAATARLDVLEIQLAESDDLQERVGRLLVEAYTINEQQDRQHRRLLEALATESETAARSLVERAIEEAAAVDRLLVPTAQGESAASVIDLAPESASIR